MRAFRVALLAGVATLGACGGDAAAPDALAGCTLSLSGNVREDAASMASCPTLAAGAGATQGDTLLEFHAPSAAIGDELVVTVDLGHEPTPGVYNSGTTPLWNASGVRLVPPDGACVYLAGNSASPTGSFVLDLASIDVTSAHGTIDLTLFVLPRASDAGAQTDCGPGTTESVELRF